MKLRKEIGVKLVLMLLSVSIIAGCQITREVPDNKYLLRKNETNVDDKRFNKSELTSYYRQKSNRNVLFFYPFFLTTYNFAHRGHERKWKDWLARVVGEEPVIYDTSLTLRTTKQFDIILKNMAYYNSTIDCDVVKKKKKAKVYYNVSLGKPTYINNVTFSVADSVIEPLILQDTASTYLKRNELFTLERLQMERDRITLLVRNNGYYRFSSDLVKYNVDTNNYQANIEVIVNRPIEQTEDGSLVKSNVRKYWINNVTFYPDYNPQEVLRNRTDYFNSLDTISVNNYMFVYSNKLKVTPNTILKANTIEPGQLYEEEQVNQTNKFMSSLRIFRQNNIVFSPVSTSDSLIDCHIQLTPLTYQNYSVNLEATNTDGNLGIGGNLNYQHKNLFKGAEIFNIKISGALQRHTKTETSEAFNIAEFGAESSLEAPSFILPFRTSKLYRKFDPRTSLTIAYNYQRRPDYTRKITSLLTTYSWKTSDNLRFLVSPIDLNTVRIPKRTEAFDQRIKGKYIENNYKDYFIIGSRYSILYQNKNNNKPTNFSYFRWNMDLAGNLLQLLHKSRASTDTTENGYYKIYNLQYAQFFKTDIDYRHYHYFSEKNQLVGRVFMGIAIPYGNATAVPFVRQYYSGGADGIRAWNVRNLGPGIYRDTISTYPNQTADIKMEFNLEYRYSISRTFKGAFFVDAGNIWAIKADKDRPGAEFKPDEFYKQFAVGTGLGFRLDLNFAVIRLDGGIKVKDPTISGSESWVLFNRKFRLKDVTWQFGIGYPF